MESLVVLGTLSINFPLHYVGLSIHNFLSDSIELLFSKVDGIYVIHNSIQHMYRIKKKMRWNESLNIVAVYLLRSI